MRTAMVSQYAHINKTHGNTIKKRQKIPDMDNHENGYGGISPTNKRDEF